MAKLEVKNKKILCKISSIYITRGESRFQALVHIPLQLFLRSVFLNTFQMDISLVQYFSGLQN